MGKKKVQTKPRVFVVAGTGRSFTEGQAELLNRAALAGEITLIAIQDNYRLLPAAQYLYGCDWKWWNYHYPLVRGTQHGELLCPDPQATADFPLTPVWAEDWHRPQSGLAEAPDAIRTGFSSGHQAIHFAINKGAEVILLVGLDYAGDHWFGAHPAEITTGASWFSKMIAAIDVLAADVEKRGGVKIYNCSADSALQCFEKMPLLDALALTSGDGELDTQSSPESEPARVRGDVSILQA